MVKVIKNKVFRLLASVAVLVSSTIMPPLFAQNLPLMPEDPAVHQAVLPDGLN